MREVYITLVCVCDCTRTLDWFVRSRFSHPVHGRLRTTTNLISPNFFLHFLCAESSRPISSKPDWKRRSKTDWNRSKRWHRQQQINKMGWPSWTVAQLTIFDREFYSGRVPKWQFSSDPSRRRPTRRLRMHRTLPIGHRSSHWSSAKRNTLRRD